MFDEIRFSQPMPDGYTTSEWFQTKDMGCDLSQYEVGTDGRLMRTRSGCWGEEELTAPEDEDFHGWLNFYTHDKATGWHEYRAKFTDGRLVEIVPANGVGNPAGALARQSGEPKANEG
jgi:hypothetical protein